MNNLNVSDAAVLKAGFGKVAITPDYPMILGGYTDEQRYFQEVISNIYITCVAASSGEETVLIYTVDLVWLPRDCQDRIRESITAATGISGEKIFFGTTHTHSAPDPLSSQQYLEDLSKWAVEAAQQAIADLAPATMFAGSRQLENMNFVRHYQNQDGSYFGANFGKKVEPIAHAGENDPQLSLLKFKREAPKKDILVINWQAHPDCVTQIGYYALSANFPGVIRDAITDATGMDVAYITGAAGNQNYDSRMADNHRLKWVEYGHKMAEYAMDMLEKLQPVEGTAIKTSRVIYDTPVNHDWDDRLEQADEVYNLWKSTSKADAKPLVDKYDLTSVYQARAIRERSVMGATAEMELNAFCIGNIGFTTGTYEMFSDNALYVKRNSPFELTFVMTACYRYIATRIAFDYRSYEGDCCLFSRGTGEALAKKYVQMLESIK